MSIELNVEFVTARSIFGWAYDSAPDSDTVKITVGLASGERVIIHADEFREHLSAAGVGDGQCGFSLQLASGEHIDPDIPLLFTSGTDEVKYEFAGSMRRALRLDAENGCFLNAEETLFDCVLVLIIKNEARYLEEWIEYHRLLGVDHFIVFDNGSTDDLHDVLTHYIDLGLVTLIDWPNLQRSTAEQREAAWLEQDAAYTCAVRLLARKAKWVGFLDIDEFFVFPSADNTSIREFLDKCGAPMLYLFWRLFGTSEIPTRRPGLVLEHFVRRAPDEGNRLCKVFVRPESVHQVFNAHRLIVGPDRLTGFTTAGTRSFGYDKVVPFYEGATIHHYHTRSLEEFREKVRRGWPDIDDAKNLRWKSHLRDYDTNQVADDSVAIHVPEVKARIQRARDGRAVWPRTSRVNANWLIDAKPSFMFHAALFVERDQWVLEGYAVDLLAPNEILELLIHDGYGVIYGKVLCDQPNEVLLMNRVSHGSHGYRFEFPADTRDIDTVMVSNKRRVRVLKLPH